MSTIEEKSTDHGQPTFRLIITGTGGQGAIRASQILAWAASKSGYQVRTAETHGMAQRGGSVVCYLGIGDVHGPLFPRGTADVILGFEETETLRNLDYANKDTLVLSSTTRLIPPGLYFKNIEYPSEEDILSNIKKVAPNVHFFNAKQIAMEAGEPRAENVVMLAYLLATGKLPITKEVLEETILSFVPAKAIEPNKKAFKVAYEIAQQQIQGGQN